MEKKAENFNPHISGTFNPDGSLSGVKSTAARLMQETNIKHPGSEVEFKQRFQKIVDKIHSAKNLDELIVNIINDIAELFESERITIFVLDIKNRQLVSRYKIGGEVAEIRLPLLPNSITGYAAQNKKLVNIKNVYDEKELAGIDPVLKSDKTWDKRTGFTTKQALALPIFFRKYLMGVLMLMNRKNNLPYTKLDESAANELANVIGVGLYNQRRVASKFNYLLQKHLLTPKELKNAIEEAGSRLETVESFLVKSLRVPKKEVGASLEQYYGVPFVEYDKSTPVPADLLKYLKLPFMKKSIWVPLRSEGDKIVVALDDPRDFRKIGEIKAIFPKNQLEFCVSLKDDILDFIALFTEEKKEPDENEETEPLIGGKEPAEKKKISSARKDTSDLSTDTISEELKKGVEEGDDGGEDEVETTDEKGSAIVNLVNKIIIDAYNRGATDIHIEPFAGKQSTVVRIRVEGRCVLYQKIHFKYRNAIISRIKIMADLNIVEHLKPQEGKIKFKKYEGLDIELRVAVIPIRGGLESLVMHFLETSKPVPLDQMGFSERNYMSYSKAIAQPYGIIIISGPIGSGRNISLHSTLAYLNKPDNKIWTAEDPVEIVQKGLSQVEVKPETGLNFAAAVRAILLADPDVVMIEEVRDNEIAAMLVDAALKGNLVFSSLYANSAFETIRRMLDMGLDPYNFSNTLLCVMTQKQVYTLCKDCKKPYLPSKEEFDEMVREYGGTEVFERDLKIRYSRDLVLYRENGCDLCNHTGYRGHMAVHELIYVTEEMKRVIRKKPNIEDIMKQGIKDGMTNIKQDGIRKTFEGHTNMRDVYRVCVA